MSIMRQSTHQQNTGIYHHAHAYGGRWFPVRISSQYDPIAMSSFSVGLSGAYFGRRSSLGVGDPHRGFETVTISYEGVVAHRDSRNSE